MRRDVGFAVDLLQLFSRPLDKRRIGVFFEDQIVVEAGGAVLLAAIAIAGSTPRPFGFQITDLGVGLGQKITVFLYLVRELLADLVDKLLRLIEGVARVCGTLVVFQFGLQTQQMRPELMFA